MDKFSYDAAQLIVPLMDFVARWGMFSDSAKLEARAALRAAGFEPHEWQAVDVFLDTLDSPAED